MQVLTTDVMECSRTRSLVIGPLGWCEPHLPATDDLDGAELLHLGTAHVETIAETGRALLGDPPLTADRTLEALLNGEHLLHLPTRHLLAFVDLVLEGPAPLRATV